MRNWLFKKMIEFETRVLSLRLISFVLAVLGIIEGVYCIKTERFYFWVPVYSGRAAVIVGIISLIIGIFLLLAGIFYKKLGKWE